MNSGKFKELYERLNNEQKKAVDTIDGPVMVIAGPGTGKTTILTLRIANILQKTDTPADAILALTFTESGVSAIRKKLVEIIGTAGYKVNIATFHGFCNDVIKQYPERFPKIIGGVPVSSADRVAIMEKVIEETKLELLRPYGNPLHYVASALSAIQHLKRENITAENFALLTEKEIITLRGRSDLYHEKGAHKGKMKAEHKEREHSLLKNKELGAVYAGYERELAKEHFYDFEDMIIETIRALRADEDFRLILQEEYQYILADEHQDANNAQNELLEILSSFHESPNLFIVGDEKQAIFRFQGASLENFLYFKRKFTDATLIKLDMNYRSHQGILDASHSLIMNSSDEGKDLRIALKSFGKEEGKPIKIASFSDSKNEAFYIAKNVKEKITSGVIPEEISVLFRENKEVLKLSSAFTELDVPFVVMSDENVLEKPIIKEFIGFLRAVNNPAEDEFTAKSLFLPLSGISSFNAFKIIKKSKEEKLPIIDLISKNPVSEKYAEKLERWSGEAIRKQALEFISDISSDSGFIGEILGGENPVYELGVFEDFLREVELAGRGKKDFRLIDLISHIDRLISHNMSVKGGSRSGKIGVRLMTAHRSKGLEFSHVFICGTIDGVWGGKRRMNKFDLPQAPTGEDDDERRLFYVAITRAKETVTISYPLKKEDDRETLPSRFIEEIDPKLVEFEDLSVRVIAPVFGEVRLPQKSGQDSESGEKQILSSKFLTEQFFSQPLSVTHLNNFLECPWRYFFMNLVRVPSAQNKHQMYGTAVHNTLQVFFEKYRAEKDVAKEDLLSLFESNMKHASLSIVEMKDSIEKGRKSLSGWFDVYKNSWGRNLATEYAVKGVFVPVILSGKEKELELSGKLDRLEFGEGDSVTVVDYKTGKPKSRNTLLGKTKDADGNYYRQLVFYKLLLDLHEKGKYKMLSGILDFTEADDSGKYRKEIFEITDGEVDELKKQIAEMAESVASRNFAEKGCGEKDCEWCEFSRKLKS